MTEYWKTQMNHELTRLYYVRLMEILKELKPKNVLEIGTGWGISGSAFMDYGVESLDTIDASTSPEYLDVAKNEIEAHIKEHNRSIEVGYFWQRTEEFFANNTKKYDFIYIDADHSYEGAKFDLLESIKLLTPDGRILMDDYLHEANFVFDSRNCGVSKAAREYLMTSGKRATIIPHNLENGFLLI